MAARLKPWIVRIGWTRVVVAVVLLGLTSLVISALVTNSQPAPQHVAGPTSSEQELPAAVRAVIINPAAETTSTAISVGSGVVQTNSAAARGSLSAAKQGKPTAQAKKLQPKKAKASVVKGSKQSTAKGKSAKTPAKKVPSKPQVKQASHSTLPSDTLFPELRGK